MKEEDPRWAALDARDPEATFVYSVKTTGVYCRPSCSARRARPENVTFHASAEEARRAGFRACRRCRPDDAPAAERDARMVLGVCRAIDAAEAPPSLAALAAQAKTSASRLARVFKAATGLTPRGYAAARRKERVRRALAEEPSVTGAIYDAGYGSSSRFYEASRATLGMTPSELRRGGEALRVRHAFGRSSLGVVLVAATDRGVCAILLGDDRAELLRDLRARFPRARIARGDRAFRATVSAVVALVERPHAPRALPLDVRGTAFQERVWTALAKVPPGRTLTYAELARAIGAPTSARAVARACASNPLAVAIPCHRVVREDGALAGYRWGVARKRALLEREATAAADVRAAACPEDRTPARISSMLSSRTTRHEPRKRVGHARRRTP